VKRSGFKATPYVRPPIAPAKPLARPVRVAEITGEVQATPKDGVFRSEAWRRAVASLPCARCLKDGPSQCAHANHIGKGMGLKAPDCWTFPLCPACHADFDQGATLTKAQKREMAEMWILLTISALAMKGLVKAS
jgi:hypothetical protein